MKRYLSLTTLFSALLASSVAYAEIFSSGLAYVGNPSGAPITCRIFNAGLGFATISTRQIIDNTGVAATLSSDSCNVALGPNKSCTFAAVAPGNLAFACRIIATGPDVDVRGVTEVILSTSQSVSLPMTGK